MHRVSSHSCVYTYLHVYLLPAFADCPYFYSEQPPPPPLGCNPFVERELRLECTVHGPADVDFQLDWFRRHSDTIPSTATGYDGAAVMLGGDSSASIQSQVRNGTRRSIRSQLRVQLSTDAPFGNTSYWCSLTHPVAAAASVTLPSDAFVLQVPEFYQGLPNCGAVPQSIHREKCAISSIPQPPSPSAASPVMPSSPLHLPTTTTITTTTSSSWQTSSPLSQRSPIPTESVLADHPTDLAEGRGGLNTIVYPLIACIAGTLGTLATIFCIYLKCHYRQRKSEILHSYYTKFANF